MKSMLRTVDNYGIIYEALLFVCPACSNDLHMLAVNTDKYSPAWTWDGNLEAPTLSPSILTKIETPRVYICHSFLRAGIFEYLGDCTHKFANQKVPLPDLPTWVLAYYKEGDE